MRTDSAPYITNKNEKLFVFTYGVFAFFIGFFISTFDIIAHVRFFTQLSPIYLAFSYIASGLLGIILSYFISSLVRRTSTQKLTYYILILSIALIGSYIVFLRIYPSHFTASYGIILFFPVNMMLLLALGRYGRILIKARHTKTIFPQVKVATMGGIAAGGASFSALLFITRFETLELVSICTLAFLLPILLFLNLFGKTSKITDEGKLKLVPFKNKVLLFFSSKFTGYLILFAILSSIVGFLIHYAFINAAWAGFFTKTGMGKFYGLFLAVATVFTYGIDKYIIKRVLYSYDSPYSILVLPAIIIVTLVVTIIGSFILGNIKPHEHFTLFFLLIAMVKVAFLSSYQAIQLPSLRSLFHTLDIRFRQVVYSRIEGGALMIGLTISGIIILGLSFLKFYSITIILIFTSIIVFAWFWSAIKLIREYKKAQEKNLSKMRFRRTASIKEVGFLEGVRRILAKENDAKIIEALKLIELHQPIEYETDIAQLVTHPSKNIRQYVLSSIEKEKIDSTLPALKESVAKVPENERQRIEEIINSFTSTKNTVKDEELIRQKVFSGTNEERSDLPLLISLSKIKEKESLLTTLTKDIEPSVRRSAVRAMARHKTEKFSYSLLDFIYPGQFEPYAMDAIARAGDSALDYLEREAMVPGTDDLVLARIMRLYGKIGSEKSIGILLNKLGDLNEYLMLHSVQSLFEHRFQANKSNKYRIHGLLMKLVSEITYNLHIQEYLKRNRKYNLLYQAYMNEVELNYNQLFRLLSLIYNPNIIESLRRLFLLGSRTQINHAIELADQYLDADIKPLLFPLLEDITPAERLKRLEYYFIQVKTSPKEIIRSTLTHDYNRLSQYPRTCAMLQVLELNLQGFESELIFNAAHPEQMLSETALFVLKQVYPKKFKEFSSRLSKSEESIIQNPSIVDSDPNQLLFTRYSELLEFVSFRKLSEFVALKLAKIARRIEIEENDTLSLENLSRKYQLVLFDLDVLSSDKKTVIHVADNLTPISLITRYDINKIIANKKTTVWLFDKSVATELVYDNVDLANTILQGIENFKSVEQ